MVQGCGWPSSLAGKRVVLTHVQSCLGPFRYLTQWRGADTLLQHLCSELFGTETQKQSLHPVSFSVSEAHKVGAITITANFDTTSLTHGGQRASPGNKSLTCKTWTALCSHLSHSLSSPQPLGDTISLLRKMPSHGGINVQLRFYCQDWEKTSTLLNSNHGLRRQFFIIFKKFCAVGWKLTLRNACSAGQQANCLKLTVKQQLLSTLIKKKNNNFFF